MNNAQKKIEKRARARAAKRARMMESGGDSLYMQRPRGLYPLNPGPNPRPWSLDALMPQWKRHRFTQNSSVLDRYRALQG